MIRIPKQIIFLIFLYPVSSRLVEEVCHVWGLDWILSVVSENWGPRGSMCQANNVNTLLIQYQEISSRSLSPQWREKIKFLNVKITESRTRIATKTTEILTIRLSPASPAGKIRAEPQHTESVLNAALIRTWNWTKKEHKTEIPEHAALM